MAINTAAARYQMLGLMRAPLMLPIPDGTLGVGDRRMLLGGYVFGTDHQMVECTIATTHTMDCTISITQSGV